MNIIINTQDQYIELVGTGVRLLFDGENRGFYLNVISLVAARMKESKTNDFVSIKEIEEKAWMLSHDKPNSFGSIESMRVNIYQKWRDMLSPKSIRCIYQLSKSYDEIEPEIYNKLKNLFMPEPQKGPEVARFKINVEPSNIEIISSLVKTTPEDAFPNSLKGMSDNKIVTEFTKKLMSLTNPDNYKDIIAESNIAINSIIKDESIWQINKSGSFKIDLDDLAILYLQTLGFSELAAQFYTKESLKELSSDPWWIPKQIDYEPGSENVLQVIHRTLKDARQQADRVSILYIFHCAYKARLVAIRREIYIKKLKDQKDHISVEVYKFWAKELNCDDFFDVVRNMVAAFKCLQAKNWILNKYRSEGTNICNLTKDHQLSCIKNQYMATDPYK